MELHILNETHIRLQTNAGGDGLSVEGDNFGPLQMLATSLALCTGSAVLAYAETARLNLEGLAIEVEWNYVDDPHRVGDYTMTLFLPDGLSPARQKAVQRAADTCTVHQTLTHSPTIVTEIATFSPEEHTHHHHEYDR